MKRTWLRRKISIVAVVSAGALFAGAGVAHADYPPSLGGSAVNISNKPSSSIASAAAVSVVNAKSTVNVGLVAPASDGTVVKYIVVLKSLTTGATAATKTVAASAGKVVRSALVAKAAGKYQVVVTAVSKSGKQTTWNGPKVSITKTLPATR